MQASSALWFEWQRRRPLRDRAVGCLIPSSVSPKGGDRRKLRADGVLAKGLCAKRQASAQPHRAAAVDAAGRIAVGRRRPSRHRRQRPRAPAIVSRPVPFRGTRRQFHDGSSPDPRTNGHPRPRARLRHSPVFGPAVRRDARPGWHESRVKAGKLPRFGGRTGVTAIVGAASMTERLRKHLPSAALLLMRRPNLEGAKNLGNFARDMPFYPTASCGPWDS